MIQAAPAGATLKLFVLTRFLGPRTGVHPAIQAQGRLSLENALLLLRHRRRSRRAFAHDQENGVLILGAIPMHLFAVMRDEAAGRHRNRALLGIEFRARTD